MEYKLKNEFIQGYSNGFLFSIFLGIYLFPFESVGQNISKSQFRMQYAKYFGMTLLKFPPMPALFNITINYLESLGYNKTVQYSAAFGLGCIYFSIVKYK